MGIHSLSTYSIFLNIYNHTCLKHEALNSMLSGSGYSLRQLRKTAKHSATRRREWGSSWYVASRSPNDIMSFSICLLPTLRESRWDRAKQYLTHDLSGCITLRGKSSPAFFSARNSSRVECFRMSRADVSIPTANVPLSCLAFVATL